LTGESGKQIIKAGTKEEDKKEVSVFFVNFINVFKIKTVARDRHPFATVFNNFIILRLNI